jgi:hypothetical protein
MNTIVITTIQAVTSSVAAMADKAKANGWDVLLVGDRRTPDLTGAAGVSFLPIDEQRLRAGKLAGLLPENHYARKNLGYLHAMSHGAQCIYDTDDDNAPLETWKPRTLDVVARSCDVKGWVNAYAWFGDGALWPRGLPLPHAREGAAPLASEARFDAPIQQGLANGSPDVDAVWRLLMDRDVTFRDAPSVRLAPGCWCPFNSQSTWWFPEAFPLMYLPSHVSFRMTDIWRSFIAQRCLWALGAGIVFHGPEVFQDRNEHNLMRDFEQEVPGYVGNDKFRRVLDSLELEGGARAVGPNLRRCYEALVGEHLIEACELELVSAWLIDLEKASA